MELVEDQDEWRFARSTLEQARDGGKEQVALGLRIGLRGCGVVGNSAANVWEKPRQLAAVAFGVRAQSIKGRCRDVVAKRFHPRPVGNAQVLVAPSVQHRCAIAICLDGEVGREPGLADARLTRDERDSPVPFARLGEQERETLTLRAPSHVPDRRDLAQTRG